MDKIEFFKRIFEEHKGISKNLEVENKGKIVIMFSGIPGCGKSHLSKKIEEEYNAIRFSNDEIRNILNTFDKEDFSCFRFDSTDFFNETYKKRVEQTYDTDSFFIKKEIALKEYFMYFMENFITSNKFIVLDSSVDRNFDFIKNLFESLNFKIFTIRMPFSEEIIKERILKKDNGDSQSLNLNFERWKKEYEEFGKKIKFDFYFKDNIGELFKILGEKIKL